MKMPEVPQGALGGDGADYLKVKDGDAKVGVFAGDFHTFYKHWVGSGTVVCPGQPACAECAKGGRPNFAFRANFITKDPTTGQPTVKIWEQGAKVYKDLIALNEDYPLECTWIKITRSGATKDNTSYSMLPIPKGGLVTDEQKAMIAKLSLHKLEHAPVPQAKPQTDQPPMGEAPPPAYDQDMPF